MALGERIPSLKLPLGSARDPAEEERLLKLFWNRAELKKELQGLDDELHRLKDKLKQQEAANTRLLEQIERLEQILGNPERSHEAVVHFYLRGLWRTCRGLIEQFVADLRRQQQDRERKMQLLEFQGDQVERMQLAEARLAEATTVAEAERARLAEYVARHASLKGFWHYFRRRDLEVEIEAQRGRVAVADRHLNDMVEVRRTIDKEPWPEFAGLSVESRRAINLAAIAFAQLLCARLTDGSLAAQARSAVNRQVQDARYGTREQCALRVEQVTRGLAAVKSQEGLVAEIRARTDQVKASAAFRSQSDTVPTHDSLPRVSPGSDANVLVEDYWDLQKTLLR